MALVFVVLAGWPASFATAAWVDGRVCGPFVCRADFPLSSIERVLRDLTQLQADLQNTLGIPPVREPIEIYLFRDKESYSAYLKRYFPNVPYRRALYIKSRGPGMVFAYRSSEFETDLRHESTHAILHAVLPVVPLWLDEGLAEYFEVPPNKRAYGNPHLTAVRWNVTLGTVPSLESLEKKGDLSAMNRSAYRYSWAWVHFMLHGSREAGWELVRYLADIQARTPPGQLSQRLEARIPGVQKQVATHFKGWKRSLF